MNGHAAVYETMLRAPGSSAEVGIAWLDTNLLSAALYSGSVSPGAGPWKLTAPVSPEASKSLVAAFNGGFAFPASGGGYYSEGRTAWPLRNGAASFVIYRNGSVDIGTWGSDVTMSPDVIAVRQNLTLLVDHGQPVPGLNPNDTYVWGATLGGIPDVWRSAVGETATGALVYVSGPALDVSQLAAVLARAGAVRGMELDINPAWTILTTYDPPPGGLASPANGSDLVVGMEGVPDRFFEPGWYRDFITMSAR